MEDQTMASGKVRELASRLPLQSIIVGSKADNTIADLIASLSAGKRFLLRENKFEGVDRSNTEANLL